MTQSLYAAFGERVLTSDPDPGTLYTASVETIDNDVILQEFAILSDAEPRPVTRIARSTDDDVSPSIEPLTSERPRPTPPSRPRPGTTLTATVETTDEDALTYLDHLR